MKVILGGGGTGLYPGSATFYAIEADTRKVMNAAELTTVSVCRLAYEV